MHSANLRMYHQTTVANRLAPRLFVPLAALLAFITSAALYVTGNPMYYRILDVFGTPVQPNKYPFVDLQYVLAGIECWNKGSNVYLFNPCDPLGRLYAYSPLWLRMTFLPSQRWAMPLGIIIDCIFLMSLALLPPPTNGKGRFIVLLATLSPPVVYALERANIDLLIFLAVFAAACLWHHRSPFRFLAYATFVFVGMLKFYPFVLLGLAVRERPRVFVTVAAASGALILLFIWGLHGELIEMLPNIPRGGYLSDTFGAINLPQVVALTLSNYPGFVSDKLVPTLSSYGLFVFLAALSVIQIVAIVKRAEFRRDLLGLPSVELGLILSGSAILFGCFFAGESLAYRETFLLLVLPGFLSLGRADDERTRKLATQMCCLIIFVLWEGEVTWNVPFQRVMQAWLGPALSSLVKADVWIIRELVWWRVVSVFGAILLCFFIESPLRKCLAARIGVHNS